MNTQGEEGSTLNDTPKGIKVTLIALKVVELCLVIVCVGLFDDPAVHSNVRVFVTQRTIALAYVTFGTFLIHTLVYLVTKLFGEYYPWKTSALMSLIAVVLFIACSATILQDWSNVKDRSYWPPNMQRLDLMCATGFTSLIVAVLFLIDVVITVHYGIKEQVD